MARESISLVVKGGWTTGQVLNKWGKTEAIESHLGDLLLHGQRQS